MYARLEFPLSQLCIFVVIINFQVEIYDLHAPLPLTTVSGTETSKYVDEDEIAS